MKKLFQLVGYITVDGIERTMKKLDGVEKKAREVIKPIKKFGLQTAHAGKELTTKLSLPLAVAGGAVVKFGADFQKSMTNSLAIMGNVSDSMRGKMEGTARDVAKTTTFSAKQAAESYFFLASAGLDAAQSMEALPKVAKFAQAGNFDLALATDLLTDAQSALGLSSDDTAESMKNMTRVSDVLVKANSIANATVQQFSESLTNKAGAALRLLGKDVEEGAAVLAVFADQGKKSVEAGTALDIVLRDLQKASIKNKKAFEEANISVYDSQGEMRNLGDIISDVEGRFEGMSDEQKRSELMTLGFTEKSVAATAALIGTSDAIKEYEKDLRSAGGVTEEVADKQLKNFWAQLELVKSKAIDAAISMSTALLPILEKHVIPAVEKLVDKLTGLVEWFTSLPDWIQKTVLGLTAFVAIAGPTLLVIGKLISAITLITTVLKTAKLAMVALNVVITANPFGAVAVAAAALVIVITKAVTSFRRLNKEYKAIQASTKATQKLLKEQLAVYLEVLDTRNAINKAEKEGLDIVDTGKYILNMRQAKEELTKLEAKHRELLGLPPIEIEVEKDDVDVYNKKVNDITKSTKEAAKVSTDWAMKLKEQNASELQLIELKRQADRKAAVEAKASKETLRFIDKFYDNELKKYWDNKAERFKDELKLYKETIDAKRQAEENYLTSIRIANAELMGDKKSVLKMQEDMEIKAAEKALSREEELTEAKKAIHEKYNKEYAEIRKDRSKAEQIADSIDATWKKSLADERVQLAMNMFNQISSLIQQSAQNEMLILDQKRAEEIQYAKDNITDKNLQEKEIAKINKKADKEKRKLMVKQAKAAKAANIFETIINTASAAIAAYKALAGIPYVGPALGAIAAGAVSAFGAVQIGIISSQPLPQLADGALIPRTPGGKVVNVAEGDDAEAILPMKKATDAIANGIVNKIGGTLLPDNSGHSRPVSSQSSHRISRKHLRPIQHVWNIGTLVADDSGIKELEQRQYTFRIAEEQRKGND